MSQREEQVWSYWFSQYISLLVLSPDVRDLNIFTINPFSEVVIFESYMFCTWGEFLSCCVYCGLIIFSYFAMEGRWFDQEWKLRVNLFCQCHQRYHFRNEVERAMYSASAVLSAISV